MSLELKQCLKKSSLPFMVCLFVVQSLNWPQTILYSSIGQYFVCAAFENQFKIHFARQLFRAFNASYSSAFRLS